MERENKENEDVKRGPLGDARPSPEHPDSQTPGSLPQEDVEDRENVSTVKPEDYPEADREDADFSGKDR